MLTSDGEYLTGLVFIGSKDMRKHNKDLMQADLKIFDGTINWLNIYFSGKEPNFIPKYKVLNQTPFRKMVIDIMNKIPYGEMVTYKYIANEIAKKKAINKMSDQAVGGAVGANPICIIIPCHRVVGTNSNLTGYGGELENKVGLLKIEKVDLSKYFMPKNYKFKEQ